MMKKIAYRPTATETANAKESVTNLLNTCFPNHLVSGDGIKAMFNENGVFWKAKGWLIPYFKRHPFYNGNLQIVLRDQEMPRCRDEKGILNFVKYVHDTFESDMLIDKICYEAIDARTEYVNYDMVSFASDCGFTIHENQKITRAIRCLAKELGYDCDQNWEKEFANFANAITEKPIKETVVISINQTDFYTNSFGDRWSTCYDIDKYGRRNGMKKSAMYKGCHCNGSQAQMLDDSSFLVYTLKNYKGEKHPELLQKKRMCFFNIGEDKLLQSRVYPDSRDHGTKSAECIRKIVQGVISEIFQIPNIWEEVTSWDYNKLISKRKLPIKSVGDLVYNDYAYYMDCCISYINGKRNKNIVTFGVEETICPECGIVHKVENNIFCEYCLYDFCEECGEWTKGSQCEFEEWNDGFYCDKCRKKIEALEAEYEEDDEEDW